MDELAREREDLAKAERDIEQGKNRIVRQSELLDALRRDGHDTQDAERTLRLFQDTLQTWADHRDAILQRIATLEAGAGNK